MLIPYGIGMYLSYQLGLAGYKTASKTAESMAQTIDGMMSLFTKGELAKMIKDNPPMHTFEEISNSIQDLAAFLHIPGAKKARGKGVEDTYVAPVQALEDIGNFVEENT